MNQDENDEYFGKTVSFIFIKIFSEFISIFRDAIWGASQSFRNFKLIIMKMHQPCWIMTKQISQFVISTMHFQGL